MDVDKIRRYVNLRDTQALKQAESDAARELANQLEQELLEDFAEAGVANLGVEVAGRRRTVYLYTQTWAKREPNVTTDEYHDALRKAGAGHLIQDSVNSNSVSAWIRELRDNDQDLPEPLEGILTASVRHSVRSRLT